VDAMTDNRNTHEDEHDAQVNEWKGKFDLLIADMDEATADVDNSWEDFKSGVESVWTHVKAAFS
jgi:hypothetical protein